MFFYILALWFLASGLLIAMYARRELLASWKEPVLRRPVMIIESDDWGAGPAAQSDALGALAALLAGFSDRDGRHPVMTLGMVLATADGEKIKATGNYQRQLISVSTHDSLLGAINHGINTGVFALQLHGLEHFWPAALIAASQRDRVVKDWLEDAPDTVTEDLPSWLQSRWVDASELPARSIGAKDVVHAVHEEVAVFQSIFGSIPYVAVPPTFVWNECVEKAWAAEGISAVVTPGRRYESRDAEGQPSAPGEPVYSGQLAENGIVYVVRNSYFEPSLGHTADNAMASLVLKSGLGQPTLFEMHRFNFLGSEERKTRSIEELGRLLRDALDRYPSLAFISTGKLAGILKKRDPEWVEQRLWCRLHVWIKRIGNYSRLRKLAWLTGWILPAGLIWKLTGYS